MRKWLKRFGWLMLFITIAWLIFAQIGMKFRISDSAAKKKFSKRGVELFTETINANGFQLHYTKTGSDTLPTLFFVHGSPGGWKKFQKFMWDRELLKKYRMVAVDRPGFGYSEFGKVKNLYEQSAIISVLLKKIQNGKPIYASGRSYGGPLVVKLAIDNPGMISGLALLAAALDPAAEEPEKWRPAMYKTPLKYFLPGAWRQSNEEIWYLKTELKDLVKHMNEIRCPVIVLHGDKDGLVSVDNAEFSKKAFVNSAAVKVQVIPGANHFIAEHHFQLVKDVYMRMDSISAYR